MHDLDDNPLCGGPVLDITTLELRFRAEGQLNLPRHPGSTLRGVLGHALQETDEAAYAAIWETPPRRPDLPKRFNDPPRAYVLEPRLLGAQRSFIRGEEVRLRLKLIGKARMWLPHLVIAAAQMGLRGVGAGRGEMNLARADALDRWGAPTPLYAEHRGFNMEPGVLPTWTLDLSAPTGAVDPTRRLILTLDTPLQLTQRGKALRAFCASTFTARLMDRLDLLSLFHQDVETTWDVHTLRALADQATIYHDGSELDSFERHSSRHDQRIGMQGLVGEVVVDQVHPAIETLWRSAEVVHVGKNATFGFGLVRVREAR